MPLNEILRRALDHFSYGRVSCSLAYELDYWEKHMSGLDKDRLYALVFELTGKRSLIRCSDSELRAAIELAIETL